MLRILSAGAVLFGLFGVLGFVGFLLVISAGAIGILYLSYPLVWIASLIAGVDLWQGSIDGSLCHNLLQQQVWSSWGPAENYGHTWPLYVVPLVFIYAIFGVYVGIMCAIAAPFERDSYSRGRMYSRAWKLGISGTVALIAFGIIMNQMITSGACTR